MDRGGAVVVPWEHWVCSQCWQGNHYAVWLIKLRCFKPNYHRGQWGWTLVSIEPSSMRLVEMRQPPANIEQRGGPVPLCQSLEHCPRRQRCQFPHSEVEYHTWEFIRELFKGIFHTKVYSHAPKPLEVDWSTLLTHQTHVIVITASIFYALVELRYI